MEKFTYLEIRKKYLDFMESKGHTIIPSASLVPENDPTVLFVNSGMFPLVPYLKGEQHPGGTKLANSQRCLRTGDIDEVGDATHLTTFEMLGNWSLNDYFKDEAIKLTVEFCVDHLGFDINNIYASVFEGNDDAEMDSTSADVWKEIFKERGIEAKVGKKERIQPLNKKENWWELAAGGPCGPDSEIFFDTGVKECGDDCGVSCTCGKFIEIGNNVFMEYLKKVEIITENDDDNMHIFEEISYSPLGRHNVDFGGGLDRFAMIGQGVDSVWETDIHLPILQKVRKLSLPKYSIDKITIGHQTTEHKHPVLSEATNLTKEEKIFSQRVVVDHIKAATWIIADGVIPGRTEREYILRRLIRRAIRHGRKIGIEGLFTRTVAEVAIEQFKIIHPLLEANTDDILKVLEDEEKKFNQTLAKGLREVAKVIYAYEDLKRTQKEPTVFRFSNKGGISFKLFETHGFPPEMLIEELRGRSIPILEDEFWNNHNKAFQAHQDKSREASKGLFKGGMADTGQESTQLHTATHLLLSALYTVAGDHIYQKGSNITPERLRLDFPNDQKLTPEQLKQVEDLVNEQIKASLPISFTEMPKAEALEKVPYAAFADKYDDVVKVYTMGSPDNPFSVEICGGPHVSNTKELGTFKITKQENVGSGIKRIKATLE